MPTNKSAKPIPWGEHISETKVAPSAWILEFEDGRRFLSYVIPKSVIKKSMSEEEKKVIFKKFEKEANKILSELEDKLRAENHLSI
jgi:hypothetical protein